MDTTDAGRVRIDFTRAEVVAMVKLAWNAIKAIKSAEELDWSVVCVFAKGLKAAHTLKADISKATDKKEGKELAAS